MNRQNLVIITLFFLAFVKTQAQVSFRPGIHAGVNLSKLTNTDLGNKTDFYIGGFGALKLGKVYTLQPELNYSRQGGKGTTSMGTTTTYNPVTNSYTTTSDSGTVDVSLQYISALTINKFNFTEDFYVLAGPFADILIADDIKANPQSKEYNFNKGDDIDFGIIGGLGYSLKNGIAFEARVKKGFLNSFTNYYDENGDSNNLVFQFGVAYTFGKK
ncbi:outer membrane beta-barrel protein [Flavobacterium foetidum]|uniref:outer membrane beta-barrel protein n=1 Tax=Flavobacterium foetidum TaxID=2026681 RepID=UPI001074F187|nr:outer membrane beta-barrel protein [Flavobacterium foetidum]KAF2511282.1 PorT family protein [Flavobacterium foetidum]